MSTKYNKGFKGIDKQDYAPETTTNSATRGRQHVQERYLQRKHGLNQSSNTTDYYPINTWRSIAMSHSVVEGSGSVFYLNQAPEFADSWQGQPGISIPTLKVYDWAGSHQTSSYTWKVGAIASTGNGNNYSIGGGGLIPLATIFRNKTGAQSAGYVYYANNMARCWTSYNTANAMSIYEEAVLSAKATQTGLKQGDSLKIQFTKDGVVSYWYALTSDDPTAAWQFKYESTTNMADSWCNDYNYAIGISNAGEGTADSQVWGYDFKFQGEINWNPYFFDKQFNQKMIEIPSESYNRISGTDQQNVYPMDSNDGTGKISLRMRPYGGGGYGQATVSDYFITGSGDGGIIMFDMPTMNVEMPVSLIVGIGDYDKVSSFNYGTNAINMRIAADTSGWTEYPGFENVIETWYSGNNVGQATLSGRPVTSGSRWCIILTGSNYGFLSDPGLGASLTPACSEDQGQVAYYFWQPLDNNGCPANEYIQKEWNLYCYRAKGGGGSNFSKAQKLIVQDGAGSDIITNIRVGENFIISGSI